MSDYFLPTLRQENIPELNHCQVLHTMGQKGLEPQTKTKPKCVNLNAETWKSKAITAPPSKAKSTNKDLNNSEKKEISNT
jgi:hypothetical protein